MDNCTFCNFYCACGSNLLRLKNYLRALNIYVRIVCQDLEINFLNVIVMQQRMCSLKVSNQKLSFNDSVDALLITSNYRNVGIQCIFCMTAKFNFQI